MKLVIGAPPKWKSKPKPNTLEEDAEFLKFRARVLSGKMTPNEQIGLMFDADDEKRLDLKSPGRTAKNTIKRALESAGLLSDFDITLRQTDSGAWALWLTYLPPMSTGHRHSDNRGLLQPSA